MHPLLQTARPSQWLKNVLVFAAPLAAGVLHEPEQAARAVVAFAAFCLGASGTYFWNDALDVDADRAHPTKRTRPVAAGRLGVGAAGLAGGVLAVASLAVMALTGRWQAVGVLGVYLAITLSYSVVWKQVAVVELVAIAAGFVLRAATGAAVVDVAMSSWFVLVTTFGALFVVAGKRFAEARQLGVDARAARATLADYTDGFLRFVLAVGGGGAVVSYCVWAFDAKEAAGSELPYYELSIVPILTAFLRYAFVLERGDGAAPEQVFVHDRVLQALGLVWVIVFGLAVYA